MDDKFGRQSVVAHIGGLGDEAPQAGNQGETCVVAGPGSPAAPPADASAPFAPATQKYEVVGSIGQGGMGEVKLVVDHDLRRDVAMKVQRDSYSTQPEMKRKFVAEAQATSQLEHPGIPPGPRDVDDDDNPHRDRRVAHGVLALLFAPIFWTKGDENSSPPCVSALSLSVMAGMRLVLAPRRPSDHDIERR